MAEAARHAFRRQRPPLRFRRPRRRRATAPWQPLALILVVAAAAWAWLELWPAMVHGPGPAAMPQVVYGVPAARIAECGSARQATCVVDGDTIRWRGERIRLSDIDAPEVFSPGCAEEEARGRAATRRLVELLNEGGFELVRVGRRDRDRYGRQLRVAMRDGRSLGDRLVAEGLARPWDGARRSWC